MHVFGMGDLAWRLFDFALMAAPAASFFVITRRSGCPILDGVIAKGGIGRWLARRPLRRVPLYPGPRTRRPGRGRPARPDHGRLPDRRDGLPVCRNPQRLPWAAAAFGLFSGVALTIKPTALPLTVAQLLLAVYVLRGRGRQGESPNGLAASCDGCPCWAIWSRRASRSFSCCGSARLPRSSPVCTDSSSTTPAWDTARWASCCCTASRRCCLWSCSGWRCWRCCRPKPLDWERVALLLRRALRPGLLPGPGPRISLLPLSRCSSFCCR